MTPALLLTASLDLQAVGDTILRPDHPERYVVAVPGSITDDRHGGCHQLIRDGAALVTTSLDVLQELAETAWVECGVSPDGVPSEADGSSPRNPDSLRNRVLLLMSDQPMFIDEIRTHHPSDVNEITSILVELEIEGDIVHLPGGYVRGVDGGHNMS
ncbi:MAG: hypothetical protein CMQ05_09400 [Gammaproteobacteria bacterium]|nr:hypothetical protein [Gammaproteobacteria bacterium]